MENIGYIFNIIAFICMACYIKSIRYKRVDENEEWRTIKLSIFFWLVLLFSIVVPYVGMVLFWLIGEFLVQDKIDSDCYIVKKTDIHKKVKNIYDKTIGKACKNIWKFLSKEL